MNRKAKMFRFILTLFVLWATSIPRVMAFDVVEIADSSLEIHIPRQTLGVYEDKDKSLTYQDISAPGFQASFKPYPSTVIFNKNHSYFWVKINIVDKSSNYKKWLLQAPLHTDIIEAYIPLGNGKMKKLIAGQLIKFSERQYSIRAIAFDLPPTRDEMYTIYIKTYSNTVVDLSYLISDQTRYTDILASTNYFLGIIYGILFLMAMYNFILYFSIHDKVYIYYVLYTLSSALLIFWKDGLGFEILWPEAPEFNAFHHKLSLFLVVSIYTIYSLHFLGLKTKYNTLYRITYVLLGINIVYFLVILFNPSYFDPLPFPYMVTLLYLYYLVTYSLINGYKPARYLFFGSTCLIMALSIIKLSYMELISWNWFIEYVLNFSIVVDVIAMSLALRDKLVFFRKEKEKAQEEKERAQETLIVQLQENEKLKDKVNKELEAKVKERTIELNQKMEELKIAQEKIARSYDELGKMSMKLDKDNWELMNGIKEERKQWINSELVSFHKFVELFPDEISCLRFIYEKKWGEDGKDYVCNRCGNTKFQELTNIKFAKKCTKCNYIETVTANTLFHGVKFDMNKAFYIVYIAVKASNMPSTQLSKEIQIRMNTCYKFRGKVESKMELSKKKNKSDSIGAWENLIID